MVDVDHEQGIRQAAHVLDTAQAALQLLQIAGTHQRFFLGQLLEGAVLGLDFQVAQALDRGADGLEVGQHAAEPAVIDERHAATGRFFTNDLASGALGADEQDLVLASSQLLNEGQGLVEHRQGFFEVDDVNLVARAEDVLAHLRVPVTGLVAEVAAGFQHIAHVDLGHFYSSISRVEPPRIPKSNPCGHPG
ncbi:hypothetical protein D3C86_1481400 [compost metagenome]